ncbi:MAG: phosphotransferase family protein [Myxococcota bacterium]|nr:phosphotransferase family protein [Myxococcota bacterium]
MEARDRDSARVVEWLEAHFEGRVVSIDRQPRWRPVWFADVEREGETLALCVRGDRSDAQIGFTLEHEMRFQQLLGERGIPVSRVHGWIDEPRAYVMDRVDGRPDFEGTSSEDRRRAMDDYISILARIHSLEPEPFADAGILRAPEPAQSGLIGMQAYEQAYRRRKKQPDPFLEFCLGWLARNPVDTRSRETPIVWDSGQFHQRDGRIVAVLDLEIGHIGDPMMDLAGFRMRDTILGFGDFGELYDRYAEITGEPVDIAAIQHHHLAFTLTNQLAFHAALADPPAESDFMTNLQWCSETNLFAVEALAEILGLELPPVEIPEPRESPIATAHRHLVTSLRELETSAPNTQHAVRILFRLARHTARFDEIGDATSQADLDDLGELLGRRPASWQEGAAARARYVQADGGVHDAELALLFHRRLTRLKALLGPAGSAMARHLPIQPFSKRSEPHTTGSASDPTPSA